MEDEQKINLSKLEIKRYSSNNSDKYLIKLSILATIINIILVFMNIQKHFLSKEGELSDLSLSHYRNNDEMNVALAVRSYDQISDYFTAKNNLDNGFEIIKDGKIVPPTNEFPKPLEYIKHIKIGYTDWIDARAMEYINYLKTNLNDKYLFELDQENPDYLLFSFYGLKHRQKKYNKCIKIAVYEEGFIPSFNEEDYIFGVAHIFILDRYFRKATLLTYLGDLKNKDFREAREEILKGKKREKFCAAVFGHENNEDHFREKFVIELSKYKKVDMGGEINNSVGYNVTNPIEFFKSYKFSIAFEKNSGDGYATGHIINSLMAGTVPIYYGDYLIDEYINPEVFILVRNDIDLMDKIDFIKEVDRNEKLYLDFFNQDILVDEDIVEKRKKEEKDYWSHIFRPDKINARRIDTLIHKTRKCYDRIK